ncbi:MAG TPA: hypothetical protein VNA27_15235 [Rubrobacteraceae bacterium]|nr:hypothetical protein [Rubrobacteraceae bacterium]
MEVRQDLLEAFVDLAQGILFVALAVAFLVLSWMFLRLANVFSTTEKMMKEVSEEVVPLIGKTHVTVDNINSQLSQLDEAVGDVTDITGELDQTTTVITRGVRGGVIKVSSATAGLSKGISAFFGSGDRSSDLTAEPRDAYERPEERA